MGTMTFGMLALTLLTVSGWCVFNKKYLLGICGSIASVFLTVLSGYSWRKMLIDSGKDTALLGFYSYPAALIILVLLSVCAAVMLIVSAVMMARKKTA